MDWAAVLGSGRRGSKGEVCLVGGPVGSLVGGPVGGLVGGVVYDKFFWHALAFSTPAHATSDIRACTENGGSVCPLIPKKYYIIFSLNLFHLLSYAVTSCSHQQG
jgi:hypothetical protein